MITRQSRFVRKPWGQEEIFAETDSYAGKILMINSGEALSLQYHERKVETLRVLSGELRVIAGPSEDALEAHDLVEGNVFHIPPRLLHRMIAMTDCHLLEVSTPDLDDVVRLDDRYGREGTKAP